MITWLCIHGGLVLFSFGITLAIISGNHELWNCPWSVTVLTVVGALALVVSGALLFGFGVNKRLS